MLGYDFWQRRFAGSKEVVGSTVRLNGEPHTIVAIAPPSLRYPVIADLWRPIALTPALRANRKDFLWSLVARLRPAATFSEAAIEIQLFGRTLAREYRDTHQGLGTTLFPFRDLISGAFTSDYTRLSMWAMALLIAIACANVANLQAARITARAREFSVRRALGGSRWRIASGVLTESLLLGVGGLVLGAILAVWFIDITRASMPAEVITFLPGWSKMALNGNAFLYAAAISLLASLAAGIWPAWQAGGLELATSLRDGGRNLAGPERGRIRNSLVVVQVALSMVLLAGGILIAKGTAALSADTGRYDGEGTLTALIDLPADRYLTPASRDQFVTRALEDLRKSPRISAAATVTALPYSGNWWTSAFEKEGFVGRASERPSVQIEYVDSQSLAVLRIPVRQGRNVLDSDTAQTLPVALVNQTLVDRHFPGQNPIGRRFRLRDNQPWVNIVGVTGDHLQDWILRRPLPTVFLPHRQTPVSAITVLLRARSGPVTDLAPELRSIIAGIDPQQPVYRVRTFAQAVRTQLAGMWYMAGMLSVGGMLSLLLSATGLFSLLSFIVNERTREVGLRMALGAQPLAVVRMILGQGLTLVAIGLVLGLGGAILLGRLLSDLIFGTSAVDPLVLGGGSLLLLLVSALACYLPASRAAHVDPMVALRQE